jgi:DnaK suppressor protein
MMGKTVIIKLPNGGYMSVGKADKERFIKAQESEAAADAPVAKKKPVAKAAGRVAKVPVGTKTGRVSAAKATPSARPSKAAPAKAVAKKPVAKAPAGRVAKAAPKAVGRTARR